MYCKHCGKQIADNSKFCSHCGKPLDENATDYMKSIHHFVASNMKKIRIILILLLCLVMGWLWYVNTDSNKIVGEWQREVRIGKEIVIYNDDGTFEHKTISPSFGDASTKGEWEIKKGIITTSFMWNGDKYYDRYEIIKLNSNDFIFKNVKESNERHFKRVK